MNEHIIEFTLKQHTPLIHFQHDQQGATLRATEVKPKLDRFLISRLNGWENISESWKVKSRDNNVQALQYKIRIEAQSLKEPVNAKGTPNYFAEMEYDPSRIPKKFSEAEYIKVSIFTLDRNLKIEIEKALPAFWLSHNFGTRQNKGFGCFYISEEDKAHFKSPAEALPSDTFYIQLKSQNDYCIGSVIRYYYQRLKTGLNHKQLNPTYEGSFLRNYVSIHKNSQWEKKWLKINFLNLRENVDTRASFWRFLLGMPYEFRFIESRKPSTFSKGQQLEVLDEILIRVSHDTIKRFASPITFSVYKHPDNITTTIYLIINENESVNNILKDQPNFTFSPLFGLRVHAAKDQKTRTLILDKNQKVKFGKLKFIPPDYQSTKTGIELFKKYIEQAEEFEKKNEDKPEYGNLKGQFERFQEFVTTKSPQTLPAPLQPQNFLKNLIQAYHQSLGKNPIKIPWIPEPKKMSTIDITVNQLP